MARGTTTSPSEREHRTMILPVSQEHYGTNVTVKFAYSSFRTIFFVGNF